MLLKDLRFDKIKSNFLLLLLSVLLLNVSPLLTIICFFLLLIRNIDKKHIILGGLLFALLLLTMVSFAYNGVSNELVTIHNAIWYTVPSVIAFLIGLNICNKIKDQRYLYLWFFMMAFVLALPHVIVTVADIMHTGLVNAERHLSVLGVTEEQRATTARTVELSLAISGIGMLLLKNKTQEKYIKLFIMLSVLAELCTLHYVSRTGVVLFLLAILIGIIALQKFSGKSLFIIISLLLLFWLFQDSSMFKVFADREIDGSNFADAGGRTERWTLGFSMLLASPNGYNIEGWYAHNFWLDFGREGGLFAFYMLVIFSIYILITTIKIQRSKSLNINVKFCVLLFSIIFIATLFTEPVHSGARMFMYFYFMFSGMVVTLKKLYV